MTILIIRVGKREGVDAPLAKRRCFPLSMESSEKKPTGVVEDSPCSSPIAPSPQPLSPILEKKPDGPGESTEAPPPSCRLQRITANSPV